MRDPPMLVASPCRRRVRALLTASGWAVAVSIAYLCGSARAQPSPTPDSTQEAAVAPAPTPGQDLPSEDWLGPLYARARQSVVRIETDIGLGAGFFFFAPGYVATAYHVI